MISRDAQDTEQRSLPQRLRFLITPKWIALIIGSIAFALACYLILAPWQFGRNAERSQQNSEIASAVKADPVPIDTLMSTTKQPAQQATWHEVTVTGTFDTAREAYVRLRQDNNGNPANEVVVPFVTADGTAVLVDRGYVSLQSVQQNTALPALPSGTVTVTGRVQDDETDPAHRPAVAAPDGRMQYTAVSSTIAGRGPVYRGYLQLTAGSPGVISPIALPQEDAGPFFSYALQWLAFGAIAVFGIGYFIYREITDPAEEDIYLPDAPDGGSGDGPDGDRVSGRGDAGSGGTGGDGAPGRGRTGSPGDDAAVGPEGATEKAPGRFGPDGAWPRVAAEPAARGGAAVTTRRRRRGGFDKSQLYDP